MKLFGRFFANSSYVLSFLNQDVILFNGKIIVNYGKVLGPSYDVKRRTACLANAGKTAKSSIYRLLLLTFESRFAQNGVSSLQLVSQRRCHKLLN
jgi:hypothetical protein